MVKKKKWQIFKSFNSVKINIVEFIMLIMFKSSLKCNTPSGFY